MHRGASSCCERATLTVWAEATLTYRYKWSLFHKLNQPHIKQRAATAGAALPSPRGWHCLIFLNTTAAFGLLLFVFTMAKMAFVSAKLICRLSQPSPRRALSTEATATVRSYSLLQDAIQPHRNNKMFLNRLHLFNYTQQRDIWSILFYLL